MNANNSFSKSKARSLDRWHEELKGAYVQQHQLTAELTCRVDQLTTWVRSNVGRRGGRG